MSTTATEPRATRVRACATGVRPPEEFCLPRGYRQRTEALTHDDAAMRDEQGRAVEYWNPERIAASARYQHHVYAWGAALVKRRGLLSVLDVGCGPGIKLSRLIAPVCADVRGIDQASAIAAAQRAGSRGTYGVVELEGCAGVGPDRTFDLVICADVIEHLLDPDPAMGLIRRYCHAESLVLLSTPDRARLRGRACMASEKPEHVREWATPEFLRFVSSRGFEVVEHRLVPGADEGKWSGCGGELMWRMGLASTSTRRCLAVLCRARAQ